MLHERVYVTQTCLQIAVEKKAIVQHSRLSLASVSAAEKEGELSTDRVCCVLGVRSASQLFTYNNNNTDDDDKVVCLFVCCFVVLLVQVLNDSNRFTICLFKWTGGGGV